MAICIGLIEDRSGIAGYRLLNDSNNGEIKDFAKYEIRTYLTLNPEGIENLKLNDNGEIISTSGSFDRYPVINTGKNIKNLTVLSKNKSSEYHCVNYEGKKYIITRDMLTNANSSIQFVNAKIVKNYLVSIGNPIIDVGNAGLKTTSLPKFNKIMVMAFNKYTSNFIRAFKNRVSEEIKYYIKEEDYSRDSFRHYNPKDVRVVGRYIEQNQELVNTEDAFCSFAYDFYSRRSSIILDNGTGAYLNIDDDDELARLYDEFKSNYKMQLICMYRVWLVSEFNLEMYLYLYIDRKTNNIWITYRDHSIGGINDGVLNIGNAKEIVECIVQNKKDRDPISYWMSKNGIYDELFDYIDTLVETYIGPRY